MEKNTKLLSLVMQQKSISIAGMCKNAGKTTVLNFLVSRLPDDLVTGLTSVGNDGETIDLVTGTEKPRVFVKKGTLVATAEQLLTHCSASREILYRGGFSTPLGQIVIFRAKTSGFVRLAGPSIGKQVKKIKDILFSLGAEKVIIDGALDRRFLASSDITDSAILSTGASYDKDMLTVVKDTAFAARILMIDKLSTKIVDFKQTYAFRLGEKLDYKNYDLLGIYKDLDADMVYLSGAITKQMVSPLIKSSLPNKQRTLAAYDASKILLTPLEVSILCKKGISLKVLRPIKLLAITCNPQSAYGYKFDAKKFYDGLSNIIQNVPIFDVVNQR